MQDTDNMDFGGFGGLNLRVKLFKSSKTTILW